MPAPARRVSDVVHDRLRADILEGRLAPGAAVASERALAEELGVNRHSVREALKRLEQAGLVRIAQGGATRVLDWRDAGGLEVLLDLVGGSDAMPPLELTRAVLEMRASIGVDAARRCAARAGGDERAEIAGLAEAVAAAIGTEAPQEVDERYVVMWRAIVVGAQNIAYRLALNSLTAAIDTHEDVATLLRPADPAAIRRLGKAVGAGTPDAAARAASTLLERDADALG